MSDDEREVPAGARQARPISHISMTKESKRLIGEIYVAGKAEGVQPKKLRKIFSAAGVPVPKSTLNDWAKKIAAGQPVVKADKLTGAQAKLTDDQRDVLVGFILKKNCKNEKVTVLDCQAFVKDFFAVDMHVRTIGNYMERAGIVRRKMQVKAKGYKLLDHELADMYVEWLLKHRALGSFNGLMVSFDFTFTSHRTASHYTYTPKGRSTPKKASRLSRCTNCILTAVWSDGVNRTPCLLFTYNQGVRLDRNSTPIRDAQVANFRKWSRKLGISVDRVVYVGKPRGETRDYVGEKASLVELFLQKYDMPPCVIFSDGGAAFCPGGGSVFEDFGYKHVVYPSAVHQFMSPNDNRLHGVAKKRWRAANPNFQKDVKNSMRLMKQLDDVSSESIVSWFKKNFMIGGGRVTREAVSKIITQGPASKREYFRACYLRYRRVVDHVEEGPGGAAGRIVDDLDGNYWLVEEN